MRYKFNPKTLLYEVVMEPFHRKFLRVALLVIGGVALFVFYLWMFTIISGKELPKTALLRKKNIAFKANVALLNRQLDVCERTLEGIEERDNKVYRSIFGLNEIPEEVMNSGFGGVNRYGYLDDFGASQDLKILTKRVDKLTKRAYVQSKALDEVYAISLQAGDMTSHIPAVPPILPDRNQFHLSSTFGYRSDPIYGRRTFHEGVDLAGKTGFPVYSTGDGVVEMVNYRFSGYGNEVLVNHGFGYKTRYAHLSEIYVSQGLAIKRGDRLGSMGSSGKSTGPHLHYEVLYKNRPVNPMTYMNLDITTEEYEAMTLKREMEADYLGNHKTSIGERIKKKKRR